MKLLRIDTDGMFIEDIITDTIPTITVGDEVVPDPQYIATDCPAGFYWPRWDGEQWVEGRTQAEIDALTSVPVPITPEERIAQLEQLLDTMLAGGV